MAQLLTASDATNSATFAHTPLQRTTHVVAPPHHLPDLETREWIHLENELALTERFQDTILSQVNFGSAAWTARAEWFFLYGPTSFHGRHHRFTSQRSFADGLKRLENRLYDLVHLHECISYELRQQRSRFEQWVAQAQAVAYQKIKGLEDEVAALKQQLEEANQRSTQQ